MGSPFSIGGTLPSSSEHEQDSCSFQLCCTLIYQTIPSSTKDDKVLANATTKKANGQDTKTLLNVMLVGMASKISKNRLRHNGIKGAMTKCVH